MRDNYLPLLLDSQDLGSSEEMKVSSISGEERIHEIMREEDRKRR